MLETKDAVVWGRYTQAELDAQYNQMSVVSEAEHEEHRRIKAEESARVRARFAASSLFDVPYGQSAAEKVDIFRPAKAAAGSGLPILVFLHGGAWKGGRKSDVSFLAEPFVDRGAVFIAVDYEHVPEVTLEDHVNQARSAVAWAYRHAGEFGGDANRLYVAGHSSGGHVCGMVAVTDWTADFGLPADAIKGAAPVSGMFDLAPVRLSWRNSYLKLDKARAARMSPIRLIPPRPLPLVIGYGTAELDEFQRQSRDFAAAWRARGHPCVEIALDGLKHFQVSRIFADARSPLTRAIFAQMGI